MGKKQVRQVRQQMRQVQPKAPTANTPGQTRKQRERYVQAGGMLQGYAPDFVIRMGYIAVAAAVVCVLAIAAIIVNAVLLNQTIKRKASQITIVQQQMRMPPQ